MQLLKKLLVLALLLAPMGQSFADDGQEKKKLQPFPLIQGHPVAIAAWAIALYAASLVTGKAVVDKFEKVVEKNIKTPQDKEAKAAHKAAWFNFVYLPMAFVGAFLLKRYAHKAFGDRVGFFGLFTAEQYSNNFEIKE